jgi:hypothetical protein
MTAQELADAIAEYVGHNDYVSHGDLLHHFGAALKGRQAVCNDIFNVVLFAGCSDLFADAVLLLLSERPRRVLPAPLSMLRTALDGTPRPRGMPRAKGGRPPEGGYKKTRFAPICFRPAGKVPPIGANVKEKP